MYFTVILEKADGGTYSVYVPDLPGSVSSGETPQEAKELIKEAIEGHIELMREKGERIPPARSTSAVIHAP